MDNKELVVSIVNFLKREIESDRLDEDGKEGLEVATECLETAYKLEAIGNRDAYPDLMAIFNAASKQKVTAAPNIMKDCSLHDKEEAERLKNEGNNLMKLNEVDNAVDCYSKAIGLDPANAVYYCNRAAAYTKSNENIKAIADCQKAISIDPNYGKAYGRLGLVYLNDKNFDKAVKNYEKAVSLEPQNASYRNYLQIAKENLTASINQQQSTGNTTAAPNMNNPLGNMDLGSLLSNPAVVNMAQSFMQNPQMQNMFASFMGGGASSGVTSERNAPESNTPNENQSQTNNNETAGAGNAAFQMPEGLDFANIMNATQQFAEQMRQRNPDLVENLRSQFQQPPPQNPPPDEGNDSNNGFS